MDGSPPSFLQEIEANLGGWPGSTPYFYVQRGLLDRETYIEHSYHLNRYLFEVTRYCMERSDWDLLLTYQPLIDSLEHHFLMENPAQPGYSPELARRFSIYIQEAYRWTSAQLTKFLDAAERQRFTLCVASDHGMQATSRPVALWPLVRPFLAAEKVPEDALRINTSGTMVSLFLPPVVTALPSPDVRARFLRRLQEYLRQSRVGGRPVFEKVYRVDELREVHLQHPRATDLTGFTYPEASPSDSPAHRDLVPASGIMLGQHGSDARKHKALRGICAFYGPAIAPRRRGTIQQLDLMPVFCRILGIDPPATCRGRLPRDFSRSWNRR